MLTRNRRKARSAPKIMEKLLIDDSSSEQRLTLAAELLDRCTGIVILDGVATLWPSPGEIECAVTEPTGTMARCDEEYKVLLENAARALQASKLGGRLPDRPLRWVVVDDYGLGTAELWRAP